jgi:phosphatidylglycerophosphatase C
MKQETSKNSLPTVAAFDFDGTITYCDTLIPFLWSVAGPLATVIALFCQIPTFIACVLGNISRQEAKERVLTQCLRGKSWNEEVQKAEKFAKGSLNRFVRPTALRRIEWHRAQGHRCILVSATLDVYLKEWAMQNGFQNLICSRLEVDERGQITGHLKGANCRGEEKVRRLKELLGERENYLLFAYGDSPGDKEMLAFADFPFYRSLGD